MKEFLIYTGLRLLILIGAFIVVAGVWQIFSDTINLFVAAIIALLLSGVGSYYMLNGPREAFARRVQAGATKTATKFDQMQSREDNT